MRYATLGVVLAVAALAAGAAGTQYTLTLEGAKGDGGALARICGA